MITLVAVALTRSLLRGNHPPPALLRALSARVAKIAGLLLILAVAQAALAPAARADSDRFSAYQQKVLFNPGASMRQAEARGRVTIYDGLDDSQVDKAMDEQFDRIEHMMFVRTRRVQADGSVEHADDGCD